MKVFIAGGGTGGHFYPAYSVAQYMKNIGFQIYYFGTEKGIEAKKEFPADKKYLFDITGVRGKGFLSSVKSIVKLIKATKEILLHIKNEKPDFALCFGGYTSVPVGLACALTGTPLFIHEQNSIPSYTNRLLSHFAKKVFITFEYTGKFFPQNKTVLTGIPVRDAVKKDLNTSQKEARSILGIPDRKTVLVVGGSQGAKKLSQTAVETARMMPHLQFILIGGKHFPQPENLPENVFYFEYMDRIGLAYSACDIAVSRAGASSTYELMTAGRYTIFVPFPYAASNHQYYNALWLKERRLAELVEEKELSPEVLAEKIEEAFSKDLTGIEKFLKNISIKNAEEIITKEILDETGTL
ncbi:UDP-N-acetylglucosamine--N-acetylmuramyl-(pentapeptide) pyrophosphoryl-undecaprenol N-acetylglucosamine transferase [Persephonella sp.]